jgi:hypothetical protein
MAQQQEPAFFTDGIWIMRPSAVAAESEPETRTAHVNEFLFTQEFTAAAEAVLDTHVELPVPPQNIWSHSPANITFEAGDGLVLIGGVGGRAIFCDRRISWESSNWLDGRKLRACLVDADRNGRFDQVMWAGALEDTYTPMFIMRFRQQALDIPYTRRTEANPRLLSGGAVVTRSPLGAYRVAFALSVHGAPVVLSDLDHTGGTTRPRPDEESEASALHFRSSDAPVSVDVFGAHVEIVSVDGSTVTYRVHSTFGPTQAMLIGYSGSMPASP